MQLLGRRSGLLFARREVLRDSFNRADSAVTLGSAELGGAYTVGNAADTTLPTFGVSGGQGYLPAHGGNDSHAWLESNTFDFTMEVDISISSAASSGLDGLLFRRVSTGNYWAARVQNSADQCSLLLNNGGARSAPATVPLTLADGQTIRLRVNATGPLIRVYVDGVLLITHSSALHQTGTKHGLYGATGGTALRWDRFAVWTGG